MPYTHFRYIAYQVPTVAQDAAHKAIYGIPAGAVPNPPTLYGNTAGLSADAKARVQRFLGAMIKAKEQLKRMGGDNNTTLKIFMAPEFYFRPVTANVSYTYDQYKAIKDVLRQTMAKTPDPADAKKGLFDGWLAVAGTVMWAADDQTAKAAKRTPVGGAAYFNTSVLVHIDPDHKRGVETETVQKNMASSIDGVPMAQAANKVFPQPFVGKRLKHAFTLAGIRFGMDICLDHYYNGSLDNGAWKPPTADLRVARNLEINKQGTGVQMHLLTAGGMPINNYSVAAKPSGYILRNDGYVTARPQTPFTNCDNVDDYKAPAGNQPPLSLKLGALTNPQAMATLKEVRASPTPFSIKQGDDLYLANPPGGSQQFWDGHPQELVIYSRRPIV